MHRTFDVQPHAVQGGARGDVKALEIRVAEGAIGGTLGNLDGGQQLALRRVHRHPLGGDVQVPFFVHLHAVGYALDTFDQHPLVGGPPVAVQLIGAHGSLVGEIHVQDLPVGRQSQAVGQVRRPCDQLDLPFRRDVVDAPEIEFLRVGLLAEHGIGEVNVAVLADHDVVGSVQALAFPLLRQYFDVALFIRPGDPAGLALAGVQPAAAVEGVPVRPIGGFAKHLRAFAWHKAVDLAVRHVAEQQVPLVGPHRALGKAEPAGGLLHVECREVLREQRERSNECSKDESHRLPIVAELAPAGAVPRAFGKERRGAPPACLSRSVDGFGCKIRESGFPPMNGSKRFESRAQRDINRDSFIHEWPQTGLILFHSPFDPKPQIKVHGDRITELDGTPEAQFDVLDRFIARHAIDVSVAPQAMAMDSQAIARMLVDIHVPRREVVRIISGLTPAKIMEVVNCLNVVEMMMAMQKMRARQTPSNQAHVTNKKENPALLAADAAEAVERGFSELETTVGVARYAPFNALAILIGSQTGRGTALTQCAVEESLGLRLALLGLTSYAETLSVYGTERAFRDGDDTPYSKAFLASAYY